MAADAMAHHVEHHQSTFRHGRLHGCWLAHHRYINLRQQRQHMAETLFARHLLLGRGHIEQVIRTPRLDEVAEYLQQRH